MFLQDFIAERNIKQSAASMYLKRHQKDFDGHTELRDGKMWLDEIAIELLSKKYPVLPVDDVWTPQAKQKYDELQEELRETNKEVRQLNAENRELRQFEMKYRALETQQLLLVQEAVSESEEKMRKQYQEEIDQLKSELAAEKNKSWWDKLRGK